MNYAINRKNEVGDKDYDDLPNCVIQSLTDGYADYAFNKKQLQIIVQRLMKNARVSMVYTHIKDGYELDYYHLIPVTIYRNNAGKDLKIRGMSFNADKPGRDYKIVYNWDGKDLILKEYGEGINNNKLDAIIEWTNYQNEVGGDVDDEF